MVEVPWLASPRATTRQSRAPLAASGRRHRQVHCRASATSTPDLRAAQRALTLAGRGGIAGRTVRAASDDLALGATAHERLRVAVTEMGALSQEAADATRAKALAAGGLRQPKPTLCPTTCATKPPVPIGPWRGSIVEQSRSFRRVDPGSRFARSARATAGESSALLAESVGFDRLQSTIGRLRELPRGGCSGSNRPLRRRGSHFVRGPNRRTLPWPRGKSMRHSRRWPRDARSTKRLIPSSTTSFSKLVSPPGRPRKRHDREAAADLQERIEGVVNEIKTTHGPPWSWRAETRLAAAMTAPNTQTDPALLARTAESQFRAGKMDEALRIYDRAWQQAATASDRTWLSIGHFWPRPSNIRRKNYERASNRYRAAAILWPENLRAAEAHLLAAHDRLEATKAAAAGTPEPAALEPFAELLDEHLRMWPRSMTLGEARWRLGQVRQLQQAWQAAIDAYRGIPANHPRTELAVPATVEAYDSYFHGENMPAAIREVWRPRQPAISSGWRSRSRARRWRVFNGRSRERSDSTCRRPRRRAALWIELPPDGYARAEQVLAPLLASPDAPLQWWAKRRQFMSSPWRGRRRSSRAAMASEQAVPQMEPALRLVAAITPLAGAVELRCRQNLGMLEIALLEAAPRARRRIDAKPAARAGLGPGTGSFLGRASRGSATRPMPS